MSLFVHLLSYLIRCQWNWTTSLREFIDLIHVCQEFAIVISCFCFPSSFPTCTDYPVTLDNMYLFLIGDKAIRFDRRIYIYLLAVCAV
jgi:hypothetical protein